MATPNEGPNQLVKLIPYVTVLLLYGGLMAYERFPREHTPAHEDILTDYVFDAQGYVICRCPAMNDVDCTCSDAKPGEPPMGSTALIGDLPNGRHVWVRCERGVVRFPGHDEIAPRNRAETRA